MDFAGSAEFRVKIKETKKLNEFLDPARELKKSCDKDTNLSWSPSNNPTEPGKETEETGNRGSTDHNITEICWIPGELRSLAITQTSEKTTSYYGG